MKLGRCLGVIAAVGLAGMVLVATPATGVVGGGTAPNGAYPFMASLQSNGSHFCGGSVISSQWVLTAAHCVSGGGVDGLSVVVGTNNNSDGSGTRIAVADVLVHPAYSGTSYDAALLRLAQPTSQPAISLATLADDGLETPGTPVKVTGWGEILPTGGILPTFGLLVPAQMKEADLAVVSDASCGTTNAGFDAAAEVCAAALLADSCQGDSGGPLFATLGSRRVQIGIVSHGFLCAIPAFPGVYSEVNNPAIRDWIRANTGV